MKSRNIHIKYHGRDQGSNVRKKSQSLVVLVNDKERIQEVRQKAAANRDKFRNASMGGKHRHGSYSSTGGYDDDRYGSRDDDRNGHGREREYRDDDHYGRYGDSYGRDGERYTRDSDERYGRDGYRDADSRGRSRSIDDSQYGSRSRSADRERDRTYEDDGQYSARGSGAKADDHSQEGSFSGMPLERKYSEQNLGAPSSYEEAVIEARSPVQGERVGETPAASAPKTSVPPVTASPQAIPAPDMSASSAHAVAPASPPAPAPVNQQVNGFDEFDPRGSFSDHELDHLSHDDGSLWGSSPEEHDSLSDLDREWKRRRDQFHTIGYRDGITAGKEASAQEGFNMGFKESVLVGYNLGLVRGVTSALTLLPDGLREKLVETQEEKDKFQSLYESVHYLSTTDALKLFHDISKRSVDRVTVMKPVPM